MLNDVRFAFRMLRKSPGFTTTAMLSLALGIGAGTAVFSLVNAILLRSLPVPNPHELRELRWAGTEPRVASHSGKVTWTGNRATASSFPHPMFLSLREQNARQADIFGFCPTGDTVTHVRNEAFLANGMKVSDNFFSVLGVRPFIGRLLTAGEDYAVAATSVVISYGWWEKHFSLDPGVLGQAVTLNGTSFTIMGVLPREFTGVQAGDPSAFYVPMSAASPLLGAPITGTQKWFVRLMARVRPGVSDARFQTELNVAFAHEAGALMKDPQIVVEPGHGGLSYDRNNYRKPLLLMLGVVGLVMLVACANLAGLSLARGAARQHELAVRAALGSGRWRLIRQSFTETLVLTLLGGGLGVVFANWIQTALSRLLAGSAEGLHYDVSLDVAVLGFCLAAALVTALLSGLLPALRVGRADPLGGLKSRGALGAPRLRAGRILVAGQVALSLLLLTGAGLYLRTLVNLTHIDTGFRTEKLLLFKLNPIGAGYDGARLTVFYERVQNSLATIPGVKSAALLHNPLISDKYDFGKFTFPDRPDSSQEKTAYRLIVSDTFFATLGIPVMHGRELSVTDSQNALKVVVVNEAFARQFLPNEDPLGRRVNVWDSDWQIVGVCHDAKYKSIKEPVPPTVYFSFRQYSRGDTWFAVRTALPPLALTAAACKAVAAIDPNVPLANITTQKAMRDKSIAQERLFASLCGALGVLAVLLSCIGLYGLLAYNVARRTREIGIRTALGATRRNVAWPILREAFVLGAIGVAIGIPATLALTRFIKSQLYGVAPTDPGAMAGAALLLLLVATVAAWFPTRRAVRVDPMAALRCE